MLKRFFIINIGTELLIGRTINGNLQWLGYKIYTNGGQILGAMVVHDKYEEISKALNYACSTEAEAVITTGGLGPTYDDITMEAVAKWLNRELHLNEDALSFMRRLRPPQTEESKKAYEKMAKLPEGSIPLFNYVGVAPGALIYCEDKRIYVLPGVPREMKDIFERYIEPYIGERTGKGIVMIIEGLYEAQLSPMITSLSKSYPTVYVKSHPSISMGKSVVRIEAWTQDRSVDLIKIYDAVEKFVKEKGGTIKLKEPSEE